MNNSVIYTQVNKGSVTMVLDGKMYVSKVTECSRIQRRMKSLREILQRELLQVCEECLWNGGMRIIYSIQNTGSCFAVKYFRGPMALPKIQQISRIALFIW